MQELIKIIEDTPRYGKRQFQDDNTAVVLFVGKMPVSKKDNKVKFSYRSCQEIICPQSWCKNCGSKSTPTCTYANKI